MKELFALIFDSDLTLTPNYMQRPIFEEYGINERLFWQQKNDFKDFHQSKDLLVDWTNAWLIQLIKEVNEKGLSLSNEKLKDLGAKIEFFKGIPEFFINLKEDLPEVEIEYYIITSGLRKMIQGSLIGPLMTEIYGCEFIEKNGVIYQIANSVNETHKTRYLFEINKGTTLVNDRIPHHDRRIPWDHMIYIGDGDTDIPCFEVIKDHGGHCLGVHHPTIKKARITAEKLLDEDRIPYFFEADYSKGSELYDYLIKLVTSASNT